MAPPPSDRSSAPWLASPGADSDSASPSSPPPSSPPHRDATSPPPEPSNGEQGNDGIAVSGGDKGKRPAWNVVPSSGTGEVGSVMGAASWPELSTSTAAGGAGGGSPKTSTSADSLKALSDGSIHDSKQSTSAGNQNPSALNHAGSVRRRSNSNSNSLRKGSGSGTSSSGGSGSLSVANGGHASSQPALGFAGSENVPESFNRDSSNNGSNNWDRHRGGGFQSQSRNGGEHLRGYGGGNRRNNNGTGSHRGGYGSRQEHERGGYDWHAPRGFSGRDSQMPVPLPQLHGHSRPFIQFPPPAPAPFFSTPGQVRPFIGPMPFSDLHPSLYYFPAQAPPFEPLRTVPYFPHQIPAAMPPTLPMTFSPPLDQKRLMLLKQIEFYFSPENLCRDTFLRQNMDDQGWVPISLIAKFNRVQQLTNSIEYILDTVRASTEVELLGHKIRKRHDWMNWILSTQVNSLITAMHNTGIEEASG